MTPRRAAAERRGRLGEGAAAWWLRLHGWTIVGRRLKTRVGEVDLVARRGRTVAFVEVKTRGTAAGLDSAIDAWRLRRVAAASAVLAPRFARDGEDIRIDVVLVSRWRVPIHLPNVWHG